MKKQTNLHSIKLLSLAMVAAMAIIIGSTFSVSAHQDKPILKDRLVKVLQDKSLSNEQITSIIKKNGVDFQLTGAVETELRKAAADNTVIEAARNNYRGEALLTGDQPEVPTTDRSNSKYKVGDRVEAEPCCSTWLRCTITDKIHDTNYAVRCDPQGGFSFMDYKVREDKIRPLKDAAPAPTFECSFEKPPGAITRTSPATAATFKRVIYDSEAGTEKRRVGVQFQIFELGKSFKNILTNGGLMHDVAARNTMVYPVKTQYKICVEGSAEYNYMAIVKQDFKCFKNSFGDWICSVASVRTNLESQTVPKDQK